MQNKTISKALENSKPKALNWTYLSRAACPTHREAKTMAPAFEGPFSRKQEAGLHPGFWGEI